MRSWISCLVFLCAAFSSTGTGFSGSYPLWGGLEAGPHDVGFRLMEETDPSRAIRVAGAEPEVRSRPVRVYIWYPADVSADAAPMLFDRYSSLADEDVWPESILGKARERMAFGNRPLALSLGPEGYETLLRQPVRAVENAGPSKGSFPLIVFGQGLYYESPVAHATLCEFLASHGFVVATSPLVGTDSLLVNMDVLDLETQTRDLEFVIAHVRGLPFVSAEELGVLGFDMGGHAGVILTMRNPDVDAFVSMDAAILYQDMLDIPADSPHHDPVQLRAPWLHVTQRGFGEWPEGYDGPSLFDTAIHSDRYLALLDGMSHADFTSYALIDNRSPMRNYWPPPQESAGKQYEVVCAYLSKFFAAYLTGNAEGRAFLARDPKELFPEAMLTIEHREASPAQPTYSDFLNALLAGDTADAIDMARGLTEFRAEGKLTREAILIRLGNQLHHSWQLPEEGIAVLELNAEMHPSSPRAHYTLANACFQAGDNERALRSFRKVVELDPGFERAGEAVKWLEGQAEKNE